MSGTNCIPLEAGWPNLCVYQVHVRALLNELHSPTHPERLGTGEPRDGAQRELQPGKGLLLKQCPEPQEGPAAALPVSAPHCSLAQLAALVLWGCFPWKAMHVRRMGSAHRGFKEQRLVWHTQQSVLKPIHTGWKSVYLEFLGTAALGAPQKCSCLSGASKAAGNPHSLGEGSTSCTVFLSKNVDFLNSSIVRHSRIYLAFTF